MEELCKNVLFCSVAQSQTVSRDEREGNEGTLRDTRGISYFKVAADV